MRMAACGARKAERPMSLKFLELRGSFQRSPMQEFLQCFGARGARRSLERGHVNACLDIVFAARLALC